jgi:group I intron endonuclease
MTKSIYIIKNKINNKVYIGQAIDPQHRFISHISRAKTNADHSAIHDAITALGKENFYYEILE